MLECKDMHDVAVLAQKLLETHQPSDILIAFDIDMTLTQPDHPAVYYPNLKAHAGLYQEIMATLSPAERDRKVTLSVQTLQQRLVQADTPLVLKNIQKMGVKTIAFTASLAGPLFFQQPHPEQSLPCKDLHTIEALRFEILKSFDMRFDQGFETQALVFDQVPAHNGQHPVFFKGILCSNGEQSKASSKGAVLVAFLRKMNLHPQVVVLVDDRKPNLESVQQALSTHYPDIRYIPIEYQGAFDYAPHAMSARAFQQFWEALAQKSKAFPDQHPI